MTRYARAKGSKASNERIPHKATPWHVMKLHLTDKSCDAEGSQEEIKSAKELLSQREIYNNSTEKDYKNDSDWAEIQPIHDISETKNNKQDNGILIKNKNKNKNVKKSIIKKSNAKLDNKGVGISTEECSEKLNRKRKKLSGSIITHVNTTELFDNDESPKKIKQKNNSFEKNHKPKLNIILESPNKKTDTFNNNENLTQQDSDSLNVTSQKLSKRQKRNKKKIRENVNELYEHDAFSTKESSNNDSLINDKQNMRHNNYEHNHNTQHSLQQSSTNKNWNKYSQKEFVQPKKNNKKNVPKIRDSKEYKRRKPEVNYIKTMINGVEIEIVKYDGFPVKKEDAERLDDLKQKMIMKGISKSAINMTMKLERRKAEKALSRIKRLVCYHCRKSGHNLSDCPELANEQSGTGICFKCGSTEHTHFECRVIKSQDYRYATCFICREQGHITKQCPDNPRGIYPDGGACKVCGDVTHLKKDCPDLITEKEQTSLTVDKISGNTLEFLEEDIKENKDKEDKNENKQKVVKF